MNTSNTIKFLFALGIFLAFSFNANSQSDRTTDRAKKEQAVSTRAQESDKEVKMKTVYVIMKLNQNNKGGFDIDYKGFEQKMDEATAIAMKKAATQSKAGREGYDSEVQFLADMASSGLEFITVLQDLVEDKSLKTYYFKKEVPVEEKK